MVHGPDLHENHLVGIWYKNRQIHEVTSSEYPFVITHTDVEIDEKHPGFLDFFFYYFQTIFLKKFVTLA